MNNLKIFDITPGQTEEAADVLAQAFEDYPMMRYFFADHTRTYLDCVVGMFTLGCKVRHALKSPLLGCELDATLIGVAYADLPSSPEIPEKLKEEFGPFLELVGLAAQEKFDIYRALKEKYTPDADHVYLQAIGVTPAAQGTGAGGALLDALHKISEADSTSTGVALDTQNPKNVTLYEKYGYEVSGHEHMEEVPCWFMFRPNESKS
jgi:GNAT superfamily N-acetyltransferase